MPNVAIAIGQSLPAGTLHEGSPGNQHDPATLFASGKHVLFAVPGAFTPTCSAKHLPGFVEKADEIKAKGVDKIVCMAVNDAFVMNAWGKDQNVGDKVEMIADGNGDLTRALGLSLDATGFGLGERGQRFAFVANDGVIEQLFVEEGGAFQVSSAENVINHL